MALLTKFLLSIKALLIALYLFHASSTHFVYLNTPETIKKPGIIYKNNYKQNTRVRYFYHFKNGTDKKQSFTINTTKIVKNLIKGSYSDQLPEKAGTVATKNFMYAKPIDTILNCSSILDPSETISGIIEGDFQKNDSIIYKFGSSNETMPSLPFYQNKYYFEINKEVDYDSPSSFRLGDSMPLAIKGQYGNDVVLVVNPKKSGILKVSFSPRGGPGLIIFENKGKIFVTNMKPAGKKFDSIVMYVEKDKKENFKFIPIGGLNYPIEIQFSLHSLISTETNLLSQ
jgi:hypothetical protein